MHDVRRSDLVVCFRVFVCLDQKTCTEPFGKLLDWKILQIILGRSVTANISAFQLINGLLHLSRNEKMSLDALAKRILGVQMDKHWKIRCSDWEAETLTQRQTEYAMNDALVAVHIFLKLVQLKSEERCSPKPADVCDPVFKTDTCLESSILKEESGSENSNPSEAKYNTFQQCKTSSVMNSDLVRTAVACEGELGDSHNGLDCTSESSLLKSTDTDDCNSCCTPEIATNSGKTSRHLSSTDDNLTSNKHEGVRRRHNFDQPTLTTISDIKESINELSETSNEVNQIQYTSLEATRNHVINDSNGTSYFESVFILNKWEAEPDKGYMENPSALLSNPVFCQRAISLCQGITDMEFKGQKCKGKKKNESGEVDDITEKIKSKPYKRGTIRKTPLYSKSMLVAPDGAKLCTLDRKKADWYIMKGIGGCYSSTSYFYLYKLVMKVNLVLEGAIKQGSVT